MKSTHCFNLSCIISLCFLFACNNNKVSRPLSSSVITPDNLKEQLFQINTGTDTVLITKNGIHIHIPAQGIKAATAAVTLVVKEALTLSDIIQAGLTTQAGNQILKSGGMFYVATKEPSTIEKPLEMQVPAAYADTAMQLFRGVEADGKIDWQKPEPLEAKPTPEYLLGKELFNSHCTSCHDVAKTLTGPALANVEKRWANRKHLLRFIRNNQELIKSGESEYARCLYCRYNGTPMVLYPAFSDTTIEYILSYIKGETIRLGIPEAPPAQEDSSAAYRSYLADLLRKKDSLKKGNGFVTELRRIESSIQIGDVSESDNTPLLPPDVSKVKAVKEFAEYYKVKISTYGWYNIDAYLSLEKEVEPSKLIVRLSGNYSRSINTFLVIPADKVFTEGGLINNGKEYGFYESDGSIPLKQNVAAYILAIGEENGKLYFGKKDFVTQKNQVIELGVIEISKEVLSETFKKLNLDEVSIEIGETANFSEVKEVDKEIERIRSKIPKAACDCFGDFK